MIHNVGYVDKLLRMLLAAIIILVGVLTGIFWVPLLAFIPLITIFFSFCPLYVPFKISTVEKQKPAFDKDKKITIKKEETTAMLQTTTQSTSEPKTTKKKTAKKTAKKAPKKKSKKKK